MKNYYFQKIITFSSIFIMLTCFNFRGKTELSAEQMLSVGSIVFAEWKKNGWYHGRIARLCPQGWYIHFDDGDKKCCTTAQVVKDVIPNKGNVSEGSRVLAIWKNGRYYPGRVAVISGAQYSIQFDDGDRGKVTINKLRLR